MIRQGKVCRVLSPNYLDVQFNLEFGITCRVCVTISEVERPEKGSIQADKMLHGLILMLGGKDIHILPVSEDLPQNRQPIEARILRKGEVDGCTVEQDGEKYVDVKMYLDKIAPEYNIQTIKDDFRRIR
jgi:hypothetical protein